MPEDNIWGLSETTLSTFRACAGVIMSGVTYLVIPKMAKWLLNRFVTPEDDEFEVHSQMVRLIVVANTILLFVIPAIATFLLSEDCMRHWLSLWTPCQDASNFSTNITLVSEGLKKHDRIDTDANTWTNVGYAGSSVFNTVLPVTSHENICSTSTHLTGRCSRTVISTIGSLVTDKLFSAAFLSLFVAYVLKTDLGRTVTNGFKNIFSGKSWDNRRENTIDIDVVVAGVILLLEYCFVLGVMFPLILPLTAITLGCKIIAFKHAMRQGFKPANNARPSLRYLYSFVLLGYALLVWVYVSNDLHGQILVIVGVPLAWLAARIFEACYPVSKAPWRWVVYDDELPEDITLERNLAATDEEVFIANALDIARSVSQETQELGDGITFTRGDVRVSVSCASPPYERIRIEASSPAPPLPDPPSIRIRIRYRMSPPQLSSLP